MAPPMPRAMPGLRTAPPSQTGRKRGFARQCGRGLPSVSATATYWHGHRGDDAMLLGAIADDFTGATDLCSMLVRGGMRTVQLIGVPRPGDPAPDADAVVVALKSRTAPVRQAVDASLAALEWLRTAGCRQFFFKYCSTFDSTDDGNIGPVADALVAALGCGF